MAQNDNVVFKTSTTATIDDLFSWNKSTGQITAKTDNIPIVPGTVYFTADGHIVHDLAQNNRLWMSKNAYSAIYAEDVAETNTDIANAIKYSIHYVEGPTTDTTPGTWTGTINGITELYDGLTIIYVPAVAGKSPTTTLNINGLGEKVCYCTNTSIITTHYSVGTPILLTYRNNCWRRADYNSNTTYSAMSVAEMRTGTATSERSIRADYLKTFLSTLGGTNLTLTHSNSAPYLQLNHDPSGITAGTYGNNSQQNPSYGGTFNIPYFTVDTQGHITNASVTTVKIPESDNTDYKVRQTSINSNDNNNYRILLSNSANDTSEDSVSKKNANLIYNPTENKLSTGNIKLTGELDVTGNVYLRNQTAVDNLTAGSLIVNGNSTFNNDINLAQGAVKWTSNSLPSVTSADYFLVIDAFANGGATKYITKTNAIKSLISSSAIGSSTKPIYWTGSAFSAITSYSGAAALTGTPTAPTAAAGTSTTQIATTEFVTNAVAQGFIANDAMVFKGLIGSNQPITQLPTSGYNAGWTYRVANAGIFAGEYCEVGDLLIAINDGPASGSSVINTDWGKVEHNIDGAVFRGSGASNSSVGSSTQPVYVNSSGIVTAITGAIANDITGNAATATALSSSGTTNQFWRGDNRWSDTLGFIKINNEIKIKGYGDNNNYWHSIKDLATVPLTNDRWHYLPNTTGWIVTSATNGTGNSTTPIYIGEDGITRAITGTISNNTTGNAATATVASKLSNTSAIGSSTQPVYFNSSGQPVAVNKYERQTGKTTNFVPLVGSDGVMEIGKYIDFHNTSEDTSNYIVRITARDSSETDGAGLTLTGTTVGTFKGNLNGTATKATQDGNGNVITSTYLPLSGGTMTGNLQWNGSTALPSTTTTDYFLAIDTFANGGTTKYITKGNALKSLISSSSIGTSLRPVYWTGSSFSQVNWFPSYCTVDGHNRNNYNYHRIATLSIGGSTWIDRDAVLVIRSRYNTSNYGIVKISGRANNNQGLLDLLAYWLIRSGFEEDSILICRKRETTDTSLGDTQVDVYLKTPIEYPRIYVYMLVGPSHLNGFQLINSEEKDNSVLSYNTSDAENPNVIDINNSDLKGSYEVYIRDKDENGNLLNSFSGYNPNNSNSQTTPTVQSQVYTHIKTALDAGSVSRAKKSSLISTNQNAIAYYTDTTGTFGQKASANGALYATSANGSLQWGTLPMAQGGTGATTAAGARTNLGLGTMATEAANNYIAKSIGTAKGDIIYWSAANTPARLNIGSVGQVLKVSSNGIPVWSNESIIGVKGNAEDNYRTGNVNITPANILGSSSTAKFWRGDNTWSNLIRDAHSKSLSTFVAIAGSDNAWNKAGNYNFAISNSNNMMVFNIGGTSNDRNAYIQVGHNSPDPYGNITGNLYLNKLGGQVYINENYAARITTSATSGQVMVADGTTGGIKTTGYTIATSVPFNAIFTDRYVDSATFADDSTNTAASPVKMTLTRAGSDTATVTASIPKISSSSAGVAPKGAAVSSQNQSTKFLREDGTWAAPSYTVNTNTDTLVKQTAKSDNKNYKILFTTSDSPTSGNANEAAYDTDITINPSTHTLTAAKFIGSLQGNADTATKARQDENGNNIASTYLKLSGGTMTGRLTLRPLEGEGGEIILAASAAEEQTQAGITIDQYNSKFRIFGSNSKDGISKINSTPLVIDPYEKTITGGYTIFADIVNNLNGVVSFVQNDIIVRNNTDWNTLVTPGCYKVQNGTGGDSEVYHGPNETDSSLYGYGLLFVFKGASSDSEKRIEQIYFPHNSTHGIYRRMHNGSDLTTGWQKWYSSTHKVKQDNTTTSNWRKILLHYKDDATSTAGVTNSTNQVFAAVGVSVQPSTGAIRATKYNIADHVSLEYDSTLETLNFVFS